LPGVRLRFADVSETSFWSIFKGFMINILHQALENGTDMVPKRRQNLIWHRENTQKKIFKKA
jgi:hypothetical protein